MPEFAERDTQTRVKHEIVKDYLIKWGSIISNGIKGYYSRYPDRRPQFRGRFIYVDYFSFKGAYLENGAIVDGSPVLGIKALDEIKKFFTSQTAGLVPTTNAIIFEEVPIIYNDLLTVLKNNGYADKIRETDNFASLRDGEIAVINDDSSKYVSKVLEFIDLVNPTYSFHFIDPYGTRGVERQNIEQIVSKRGADCIINMMLNPISRWIAVGAKDEKSLTPSEKAHAESLDKYYGSDVWRGIQTYFEAGAIDRAQAEQQLVEEFDKILHKADDDLTVKQIPLKFQDREQTIYYLFLTTHDPTGSFAMNEILADATIREYDYRVEKRRTVGSNQTSFDFFADIRDEKRPTEPEADIDLLADQIYTACQKQTLNYRDILKKLANSPYFQQDVREALGKLREQKRAFFEGAPSRITNNSEVRFE